MQYVSLGSGILAAAKDYLHRSLQVVIRSACVVGCLRRESSDLEAEFLLAGCSRKSDVKVPLLNDGPPPPYEIRLRRFLQERVGRENRIVDDSSSKLESCACPNLIESVTYAVYLVDGCFWGSCPCGTGRGGNGGGTPSILDTSIASAIAAPEIAWITGIGGFCWVCSSTSFEISSLSPVA